MDSARWERIQILFHHAIELPECEQQAYLAFEGGEDTGLVAEVTAMLRTDGRKTSFLDRGLADLAPCLLDTSLESISPHEFGPYRLKRVLGEGGMGVVWLAERLDAGNLVAIKFLPHAGLSPARRERFTREIKMLAKLTHPFIARLYDAGTLEDGTPWFVMEYVEGLRITDYCSKHALTVVDRLRLFRSVCEAVHYAHTHEIVHRDLKPSNILVDQAGSPRLLDFGIAKEMHTENGPTERTRPGLRVMSLDYASPEWIRDDKVGFYTDVYSLGVILYELLTGHLPCQRSNGASDKLALSAGASPIPPSCMAARSDLGLSGNRSTKGLSKAAWGDLDTLCLKAVREDALERYSSVEGLVRDIDHYLKHEPLDARPDTLRYRLGKFVVRNQPVVVTSALLLITTIGFVLFFTVRLATERNRASYEANIADAMNQFLTQDLLARSDPFHSGNAKELFVDVVDQASSQIDRAFRTEPLIAARLHTTIALAFDGRSEYARARPEFDRAVSLFTQVEGFASRDAVITKLQRADMEARSGDPGSTGLAERIIKEVETAAFRTNRPNREIDVRILSSRGLIAMTQSDPRKANGLFEQALHLARAIPGFDVFALQKIEQRLAFTFIRLGEGAKAEALFRDLIDVSLKQGVEGDLNALPFRVNLAQALLVERKYDDVIKEVDALYPILVAKLGEGHDAVLKVLGARAAAEGSLDMWGPAIRDDLAVYNAVSRKQGVGSLLSIVTLSDAALSQCRAGQYAIGESNARTAFERARKALGARTGATGGASYTLAICLMGLGELDEASALLANIDVNEVARSIGDPSVRPSVALAKGEIAARKGYYAAAEQYLREAAPTFDRADASAIDRQSLQKIRDAIAMHSGARM